LTVGAPPDSFALNAASVSVPAHVVYRAFAGETVILNLETGKYHGLNVTGGRMLQLLDGAESIAEAASAFARDYGKLLSEVEGDIRSFCTRLCERGLIDIRLDGSR
jgi:Coenzyme PQQ synthesis protein D (PqqD)